MQTDVVKCTQRQEQYDNKEWKDILWNFVSY